MPTGSRSQARTRRKADNLRHIDEAENCSGLMLFRCSMRTAHPRRCRSASPAALTALVAVSVPDKDINGCGTSRKIRFTLSGAIPPRPLRLLLVTWISDICVSERGATSVMD